MKKLSDTVSGSNTEIERMFKVAQDLLYEAKCHIAIGDEDPKDANPMFSLKEFRKYMK